MLDAIIALAALARILTVRFTGRALRDKSARYGLRYSKGDLLSGRIPSSLCSRHVPFPIEYISTMFRLDPFPVHTSRSDSWGAPWG